MDLIIYYQALSLCLCGALLQSYKFRFAPYGWMGDLVV